MEPISLENVTRNLSVHIPFYSWHRPVYQHVMLETLQRFWDASHRSALDVGGGTGVVAQTTKNLFCLERVASVDVENRFLKSLNIETAIYDGRKLPFPVAAQLLRKQLRRSLRIAWIDGHASHERAH
jgi:hypothetical protein